VLTVLFAVAAAIANALSSILQRRGAGSIPESESMRLALLIDVVRRPIWLLGLLAMCAAFIFQAAALAHGDLALVQPVLIAELPVTLLLAPLFFGGTAGRRAWLGVVGMSAGLAAVLLAAAPSAGQRTPSVVAILLTVAATGGLIGCLVLLALRMEGSPRAATFGTAAGAGFALTAALMKEAMDELTHHGVAGMFGSWSLYAMALGGLASLFLWQNALQAGTLIAAQPAITLSDPILSTLIGVLVFGERVRLGGWIAMEFFGALLVAAASVELARSPLISGEGLPKPARQHDQEAQPDLL
jgi:drug/metabolite transporter (DMT)-like permease